MNNVSLECDMETGEIVACVRMQSPRVSILQSVFLDIEKDLGQEIRDEIDISSDVMTQECVVTIPVNPFAEKDTFHRMMVLQWLTKRVATFAPPIDVPSITRMQRLILH